MPGILEFYLDRLKACLSYGFSSGEQILSMVHSCAYYDRNNGYLTQDDFILIINECERTHIKLLEVNYNENW